MLVMLMTFVVLAIFVWGINEVRGERILSSGLNNWTSEQLGQQYDMYQSYSKLGIIDGSSILVYYLDDWGNLATFQTADVMCTAEQFQEKVKKELRLKAYPCLYCDATIGGPCANLPDKLEKLFGKQDAFIASSIEIAKKYGWDGYTVDFEPDGDVNSTALTDFMFNWAYHLNFNGLALHVWIGGPTQYEMDRMFKGPSGMKLMTMNTYFAGTKSFFQVLASYPIQSINDFSRLGFGLLTYSNVMNKPWVKRSGLDEVDETDQSIMWVKSLNFTTFALWASSIPPAWWVALSKN